MCDMDKPETFLLEEYKSAVELTFHIDSLRNKLTSFFISFAGLAVAGLLLLLKKDTNNTPIDNINEFVASLMILVAFIGHLFIIVLAKLRKAQLEHFRIINNIRKYFLNENWHLWNVVQLSEKTLPKPSIYSGTFFWLLILQILNSAILFIGIFLIWNNIENLISCQGFLLFIIVLSLSLGTQTLLYLKLAKPPLAKIYSKDNPAFTKNNMIKNSPVYGK
jgi:hypothetical protein